MVVQGNALMPRKKKERVIWQQRFNLSSDNPADVRLHDYLLALAENGDAAKWIRDTLYNAVPSEYNSSTTIVPEYNDSTTDDTTIVQRNEPDPPKFKSGMATPKGSMQVPANYRHKPPVEQRSVPSFLGTKTKGANNGQT